MAITIKIKDTQHCFEKQNLVTLRDRRGFYDLYRCQCGVLGKSYQLGRIRLDGINSIKSARKCLLVQDTPKGEFIKKKVKVTQCNAYGPQFENLLPGTIHEVVEPPEGYRNGEKGMWVMGVSEPVLLLFSEYKEVV